MSDQEKPNEKPADVQYVDEQDLAIERLLEQVQPGYSLVVWRLKPTQYASYLEEFEIDPTSPIDLSYLAHEWGGEVLQIKLRDEKGRIRGGATLNFKSYPPKHRGVPLRADSIDVDYHKSRLPGKQRRENPNDDPGRLAQVTTVQPSPVEMLKDMLTMVAQTRQEDLGVLRGLLSGPDTVPKDPIGQMLAFARAQKEMREIFGTAEAAISEGDNDHSALFKMIGDVAKSLNFGQKATPQTPNPALPVRRPVVQNDINNQQQRPQAAPELSDMLAAMNPDLSVNIIIEALNKMPDERKKMAIMNFTSRLGDIEEVDSTDDDPEDDPNEEIIDETPDTPPTMFES